MKIGIIGTGNIGGTLIKKLSAAGHDVTAANSRGPESIPADLLEHGATAGTPELAFQDAQVVILSVPLTAVPKFRALAQSMDSSATLIDTSNYYPGRDGADFLEEGALESGWVQDQLGRPIVKAFNSIGPDALASGGSPEWVDGVIALPISADRTEDADITQQLLKELGFDSYYVGPITESWRQQPGNPVYGTDLTLEQIPDAVANANRERAPHRRDLFVAAVIERLNGKTGTNPPARWGTELSRLLYME